MRKLLVLFIFIVAGMLNFCACMQSSECPKEERQWITDDVNYFIMEIDSDEVSLEKIELFLQEQNYNRNEDIEKAMIGYGVNKELIIFNVFATREEAKSYYQEKYGGSSLFRNTSYCRINNLVIYATNKTINSIVDHFKLDVHFRNVMVTESYTLEDVFATLQEFGFAIYEQAALQQGLNIYEAASYCGRVGIVIYLFDTTEDFLYNFTQYMPDFMENIDTYFDVPVNPNGTLMGFEKGKFILVGDLDWLWLIRNQLAKTAS